jgi:3-hydroxyisobutyrate dehydrogenase-like beta-hydroxyacid dehydrogenase
MDRPTKVGFIGLGNMGQPMAARLLGSRRSLMNTAAIPLHLSVRLPPRAMR